MNVKTAKAHIHILGFAQGYNSKLYIRKQDNVRIIFFKNGEDEKWIVSPRTSNKEYAETLARLLNG